MNIITLKKHKIKQKNALCLPRRYNAKNNGFIQQANTPSNIYECLANMFVASFIGLPQMNFIELIQS